MLERLIIANVAPFAAESRAIAAELPGVLVTSEEPAGGRAVLSLGVEEWRAFRFDVYAFDAEMRRLADQGSFDLRLLGPTADCVAVAIEVLGRCQRFIRRRNRASEGERFERLLALHRELHRDDKPLVRADWEHALDTWQWMLRLDPDASLEVQAAALFHDIERLASESDARVEHLHPDYQAFKDEHARRGAVLARHAVLSAGLGAEVAERVAALVREHERPGGCRENILLNDADGLSFFSLNSYGFFDYFGPEHTRRKVVYTLSRMRRETRARLREIRLRPEVESLARAELDAAKGGD